jgi:tetratricopeptide (TPR) repeat protein
LFKRFLAVALLAVVLTVTASGAGDILQQLGVSRQQATESVVTAFINGSVNYSLVRDRFKAATPQVRAALVEQVLTWTKAYVNSPQFEKDYATYRAATKPEKEEISSKSVDEELKARRAQRAAEQAEARKSLAEIPAEYRKQAEEAMKAAEEAQKAMDTPEMREQERQMILAERQDAQTNYQDALQRWEEEYPADPKAFVPRRLQEFLDETADVDFSAKLVNRGGRMYFVSEEYQSKPGGWKLAFRAGKEATERARAFAEAWLAELQ